MSYITLGQYELLEKKYRELKRKNKKQLEVIDLMAKAWKQDDIRSVEEIKQYFYRKVEEDE